MEARLVDEIPRDAGWQYEPKWDGFRCLAFRSGDDVALQSKSGTVLARYFPEVVASLLALDAKEFVLDGELVVPCGDALSFDDLLQRIHPAASRIERLSKESPATYLIFDLLADEDGTAHIDEPLEGRRKRLERFFSHYVGSANRQASPSPGGGDVDARLRLSPATRERATVDDWFARVGGALDGIVAKRLAAPYRAGERDAVVKVKAIRSADCVIGGYRVSAGDTLGSLLLGLYDDGGRLDYVGFTSGFAQAQKRELMERLRPLHAPASFDGRTPGGPSRWNRGKSTAWQPLRPELVLEVAYDQVTGDRFRHGTRPLRWRPDKAPRSCSLDQIQNTDRTLRLFA
ncbi:MAG: ATP-dependent DNA ligase [Candidatus Eremiobacteraeota bacterium]|nr:ATP-dependent DNA ligase [Candidatus Eremiobacteraeota bacterium]